MFFIHTLSPFFLVVSLQLGYAILRQQILRGFYAMSAFSAVWLVLNGLCLPLLRLDVFKLATFLLSYGTSIALLAFVLSHWKPIRSRLLCFFKRSWYSSLSLLFVGSMFASLFQAYQYNTLLRTGGTTYTMLTFVLVALFMYGCVSYFSLVLMFYHAQLRLQTMLGTRLVPLISALDLELKTYQSELTALKTAALHTESAALITTLEDKLAASKMPLYADSTDASLALYHALNPETLENTWLDTVLLKMPTPELALLITLLCSYLNAYDPLLIRGIQLTPLTEGRLVISLQSGLMTPKHLQALIRHQHFKTQSGTFSNRHVARIAMRYLISENRLAMKLDVSHEGHQAIVIYPTYRKAV